MTTMLVGVSTLAFAQVNVATDITSAQIKKVLREQPKATDHTLRVLDLGDYQLGVAVVHRGPTAGAGAQRRTGPPPGQAAAQSSAAAGAAGHASNFTNGQVGRAENTADTTESTAASGLSSTSVGAGGSFGAGTSGGTGPSSGAAAQ